MNKFISTALLLLLASASPLLAGQGQEDQEEISDSTSSSKLVLHLQSVNNSDEGELCKDLQSMASLKVDTEKGMLSISGWAVDTEKKLPSQTVVVFYKNNFVGAGAVNHLWGGVTHHFNSRGIPGNYDWSGSTFEVSFPAGTSGFNHNDIQVMTYSGERKNIVHLYEKKIVNPILLDKYGNIFHRKVPLLKNSSIKGWAGGLLLHAENKTLTIGGWSACEGVGPGNYVTVFYKRKVLGSVFVDKPSGDVDNYFHLQGVLGDYSSCRYSGNFDVSDLNLEDFNPQYLRVVGFDSENKYNDLAIHVPGFIRKGEVCKPTLDNTNKIILKKIYKKTLYYISSDRLGL